MTDEQTRLVEDNVRLVYYFYGKLDKSETVIRERDDLISEGFIGLIKAAKSFIGGKSSFATYAARCITNQMFMWLRKIKRQEREIALFAPVGKDAEGEELLLIDTLVSEGYETDKVIERLYAREWLDKTLLELPERDKKIIALRCSGKTQIEIAAALGYSQSYISRILLRLKKRYKKTR
jgi:RNA polymerase sporulation-specific sigma factor